MKLYLVRHGQTDYNIKHAPQGVIDIPLNETGKAQARELGQQIKSIDFDAYYVSPLKRARQTAEIITGGQAQLQINELLRERSFGDVEGKIVNWDEIGDIYDPQLDIKTHGIEPISHLIARTRQFLEQIRSENPANAKILIVAHGALLRALHYNILGTNDAEELHRGKFENCELREYDF